MVSRKDYVTSDTKMTLKSPLPTPWFWPASDNEAGGQKSPENSTVVSHMRELPPRIFSPDRIIPDHQLDELGWRGPSAFAARRLRQDRSQERKAKNRRRGGF